MAALTLAFSLVLTWTIIIERGSGGATRCDEQKVRQSYAAVVASIKDADSTARLETSLICDPDDPQPIGGGSVANGLNLRNVNGCSPIRNVKCDITKLGHTWYILKEESQVEVGLLR